MNHIITIKGYPIEVFVQNIDTPPQATAGVYSITNNDWVEIPEKLKPETEITDENVKKIVKQYMEKIDALEISFTLSPGVTVIIPPRVNSLGALVEKKPIIKTTSTAKKTKCNFVFLAGLFSSSPFDSLSGFVFCELFGTSRFLVSDGVS